MNHSGWLQSLWICAQRWSHPASVSPGFIFLFSWVSQTGSGTPRTGWKIPLRAGRKGGRGLDSKSGLQWEGKGSRSCLSAWWDGSLNGGGGAVGGSYRVLWGHSLLSSHSQLPGPGWVGGRGGRRGEQSSHDVHSSSMLDLELELNGDNEVDPAEYRWVKHWVVAARHEWMSLKGTSTLGQTSLHKQKVKIKPSGLNAVLLQTGRLRC